LTVTIVLFAAVPSEADEIDALLAKADELASAQVRRAGDAIPIYRQAIRLAAERNDAARLASAHLGLGGALINMHDQKGARAALEEARRLAGRAGLHALEAETLGELAILQFELGEIDSAERLARESQQVSAKHGLAALELRASNLRLAFLRRVGRTAEAIEAGSDAFRRLETARNRGLTIPQGLFFQIPYNYGRALIDNGQYSRGFALFDRAHLAATEQRLIAGVWHILEDTAEWYLEQSDYARAGRYYQRALAQSRMMESRDPEALTLLGLARLNRVRGRLAEAERHGLAAMKLARDAGVKPYLTEALLEIARIQSAGGKQVDASTAIRRANTLAGEMDHFLLLTLGRIELARIERQSGRRDDASAHARDAVALARANGLRPLLPLAWNELGQLALDNGDLDSAAQRFEESVAAAEAMRSNIHSPQQRSAFAEGSHAAYAGLLEARLRMYRREPIQANVLRALEVVERERAAPDQTGRAVAVRSPALDARVAQLQWMLSRPGIDRAQRTVLLTDLDDAERQIEAADAAAHESPSIPNLVSLGDSQRALQAGEIVLEYASAQSAAMVFAVTRDDIRLFEIGSPTTAARSSFFTALLCSGRGTDALPAGMRLSQELLVPALHGVAPSTRRIFIAAAGDLAALPFAALPWPPQSTTPLLAGYEVAYVPSLTALGRARQARSGTPGVDLLAFSNPAAGRHISHVDADSSIDLGPLPFSSQEIQSIQRFVKSRDVLEGAAASEAALKSRPAVSYQILHFATHAILDPISPRRSAVILARGSETEDGLLQARDIQELRLGGQLVVLSGCETSSGNPSSVEGALSLARAFLSAGANAVVGTLADVDDRSSSDLVARFYKRLARGEAVGSALRGAQLDVAGPRPYETAALWAPWIVSGNGTMGVTIGGQRWRAAVWIVLPILGVLAVLLWRVTRARPREA
jgi:tetratricopeptide (TPR) repeat protein